MLDLRLQNLQAVDPEKDHHCGLEAPHDPSTFYLSLFLCVGVVVSYLPQHIRIIRNKTGEGISTGYLLLGSTSSACALLNIITLQFGVIRCCTVWSAFGCFENVLGILQIFLQWSMFNIILLLFIYYYPPHLKFAFVTPISSRAQSSHLFPASHSASRSRSLGSKLKALFWPSLEDQVHVPSNDLAASSRESRRASTASSASEEYNPVLLPSMTHKSQVMWTNEYRHAIAIAVLVAVHLVVSLFITGLLLLISPKYGENDPADPDHPGFPHNHSTKLMLSWATVLGLQATVLAGVQFVPQLWHTWTVRLVGSLSIPTMLIQTPGSFIFVYSYIAGGGRPGTNWTTWLVYLVTGSLQGVLLVMCCMWKLRQKAIGVDDYGQELPTSEDSSQPAERQALLRRQPSRSEGHA